MIFTEPVWLFGLFLIPLIWYFYYISNKKRKKEAAVFSHLHLVKKASKKSVRRQQILIGLNIALVFLLVMALADLHIPLKRAKEGVNVVLVLDVSGSMQATDYKPNRIESAKQSAEILVESLEPKDYAGIVVFESGATTAAYLSPFKDRVIEKLRGIKAKDGRTAIGDGLALAIDMAASIPNKKKTVILMSDGVNNAGVISPQEAVDYAKQKKIQVFTIGLGSADKVVLGYDFFGNPQYAELDEDTLRSVASQTEGKYYKSVDEKTLKEIYSQISTEIERQREPTSIKDWLVLLAIAVVLVEFYFRYWKYRVIQ